jgi:hypothetical protein
MSDMGKRAGTDEVLDNGERLHTSFYVSLEGDSGHTGVDLRRVRVWYDKNGKQLRWEVTETHYDFGPHDNPDKGDVPGDVLGPKSEVTSGDGAPPDLPTEPDPNRFIEFFPVDEDGYQAARRWAEPQVTLVKRTKKKEPPGKPHRYNIKEYNCGSWSLEFLKKAGGPDIIPSPNPLRIRRLPANILAWSKRKHCKHQWEDKLIWWELGKSDDIFTIQVCKLCGMIRKSK